VPLRLDNTKRRKLLGMEPHPPQDVATKGHGRSLKLRLRPNASFLRNRNSPKQQSKFEHPMRIYTANGEAGWKPAVAVATVYRAMA